jgi:hypothetical protein
MSNDHKKVILVLGAGLLLFWIFKPKMKKPNAETNVNFCDEEDNPKERKKMDTPTMSPESAKKNSMAKGAFAAMKAYIDAYNNGEPQSVLDELNREFAKEFKCKVYRRKSDRKLVATDLQGKEILINN